MRRGLLAFLVILATACTQVPVTDEITIEPSEHDHTLTVSVTSSFLMTPQRDDVRERVEAARAAALSNTDPWSIRFGRLPNAIEERHTTEKSRGVLRSVTRAARIPADDLQQLLSDTGITTDVVRGEGWTELRLYPASDGRATRREREQMEETLDLWSRSVTRYFTAIHHLYSYLDQQSQRAQPLFAVLLEERAQDDSLPELSEEEEVLLDAVTRSMEEIAARMDTEEGQTAIFELADLVFNPFPGRVTIRTPGEVLSSEGFARKGNEVTVEPVNLFESLQGLEGRWISPDPLAAAMREEKVTSQQLAQAERMSTASVSSSEVTRAIREQLVRPRSYVVRWRE